MCDSELCYLCDSKNRSCCTEWFGPSLFISISRLHSKVSVSLWRKRKIECADEQLQSSVPFGLINNYVICMVVNYIIYVIANYVICSNKLCYICYVRSKKIML
jgi:hypothetical protein